MQKQDSTSKRPRRSRMPQEVYDAASNVSFNLRDNSSSPVYPSPRDETLCQEIAAPLRELSSLADKKELPAHINEHPHVDPYKAAEIIREAMRLAYGIQDLIDAGERVAKRERQRVRELFAAFQTIKQACDESQQRQRAIVKQIKSETVRQPARPAQPTNENIARPTGRKWKPYAVTFNWPYYGVHNGDTLFVEENGAAPIGKLVLVKDEGERSGSYFARICDVRGDTVRLTNDKTHYEHPITDIIGPVVDVHHGICCPVKKIEELRAQIAKLQDDEQAWANVTKVYELEQEIFALERKLAHDGEDAPGDDFEWPEVIGDE